MALQYQSTPEQLAELVTKHLNETFKDAIKQKLLKQLDPIVEEIAQDWADALEAKVFAMNDYSRLLDDPLGQTPMRVALYINKQETPRRPRKPE